MITNEREYKATLSSIRDFEEALRSANAETHQPDPKAHEITLAGVRTQIENLKQEVAEYKALRDDRKTEFEIDFAELADALIFIRNASNLSQAELAEKLGVKQQQIQRYEANEYEQADFARLKEIVWALGVSIRLHITMPTVKSKQTEFPAIVPHVEVA